MNVVVMKPSEVLIAARELLSDKTKWAQGYYAYNKDGRHVEAGSDEAVCFCSIGAVLNVMNLPNSSSEKFGTGEYLETVMGKNIPHFNDIPERTHEEILAKFDEAITLAQAAGE